MTALPEIDFLTEDEIEETDESAYIELLAAIDEWRTERAIECISAVYY